MNIKRVVSMSIPAIIVGITCLYVSSVVTKNVYLSKPSYLDKHLIKATARQREAVKNTICNEVAKDEKS